MKKTLMFVVVLLVAMTVSAGEGKSCDREAKNVKLTGTVEVQETADGKTHVFRVADSDKSYSICNESKVEVAKLNGATVKVSGKLVNCDKGKELVIDSAARI